MNDRYSESSSSEFNVSQKLLLGPGPSNLTDSVKHALAQPALGHLDPEFLEILDETCDLLRWIFKTENKVTFPISATASGGMEAVVKNLVNSNGKVVIASNGAFSLRAKNMMERLGAKVTEVSSEWGTKVDVSQLNSAIKAITPDLIWIVHGETSTGVLNKIESIDKGDALLVVDCVTSLGGVDFRMDEWGIDVAVSGTQKCLNAPPGLSPVSFSPNAIKRLKKSDSWYFDLGLINEYISSDGPRTYHHTAPINMIYALRASLLYISNFGLTQTFEKHRIAAEYLYSCLEELGMELVVPVDCRLPQLTTVFIPENLAHREAEVRRILLSEFNIEIGAGLGVFAGKVWRIGMMGVNATTTNVDTLINALSSIINN